MIQDLIKLRGQLHDKYKRRYFIVKETSKGMELCGDGFSFDDIEKLENTDEVIVQMEDLMKKGIEGFYQNNVPIGSIGISSGFGLVCTKDFFESLQSVDDDEYYKLMLEYWQHSSKYIPVNFSINDAICSITNSDGMDEYGLYQKCRNIDFLKKCVSGIVDFDKFVLRLKNLGYNLELLEYEDEELSDFDKLRELLLDSIRENEDIQLNLEVCLVKENDSTGNFVKKYVK